MYGMTILSNYSRVCSEDLALATGHRSPEVFTQLQRTVEGGRERERGRRG